VWQSHYRRQRKFRLRHQREQSVLQLGPFCIGIAEHINRFFHMFDVFQSLDNYLPKSCRICFSDSITIPNSIGIARLLQCYLATVFAGIVTICRVVTRALYF
jgi:hypothetical protein